MKFCDGVFPFSLFINFMFFFVFDVLYYFFTEFFLDYFLCVFTCLSFSNPSEGYISFKYIPRD